MAGHIEAAVHHDDHDDAWKDVEDYVDTGIDPGFFAHFEVIVTVDADRVWDIVQQKQRQIHQDVRNHIGVKCFQSNNPEPEIRFKEVICQEYKAVSGNCYYQRQRNGQTKLFSMDFYAVF